jgi:hypothetical protein
MPRIIDSTSLSLGFEDFRHLKEDEDLPLPGFAKVDFWDDESHVINPTVSNS